MQIQDLHLATPDLSLQHAFYAQTLGLPALQATPESVTFRVGASRLTFAAAAGRPIYHFAFNIPENQFDAAVDWLRRRVPLIADSAGTDIFYSEGWNAHNVYFYDPGGNIVELIARHDLPGATDRPFDAASLLNISEIGIAADDVPAQVAAIQERVDAPPFRGPGSDTFTPLGDDEGLFIVVQRGRIWYPETGKPAEHVPITMVVHDGKGRATEFHFG